jgi:hypothetical protein
MARPIDYAPILLSSEDVTVCAGREVLMEVDNNSALIVGNPKGILGQQLRPYPILFI